MTEENIAREQSGQLNQSVEVQSQRAKPWFKIALFSILGLGLAGGLIFAGYFFGKNLKLKAQISKPQLKSQNLTPTQAPVITSVPTPQPTTNLLADETADWKTYTSTKYRYSIKYPPGWSIDDTDDGKDVDQGDPKRLLAIAKSLKQKDNENFVIYLRTIDQSLEEFCAGFIKFMPGTQLAPEDTKINDALAKRMLTEDPFTGELFIDYVFDYDGFRWQISFPAKNKKGTHNEIFDQILSTFKVLD